MKYNTILVEQTPEVMRITINRPEHRNSINLEFLRELNEALDIAEENCSCKIVILEGHKSFFCIGMDFEQAVAVENSGTDNGYSSTAKYMGTIRRLSLLPKIVIAKVEGEVMAGGVGIAAASDIVVASPDAQFSLSEALWGLLPSMVIPYLIRRVGYQKAYSMTLTTMPVTALEAFRFSLVDYINDEPEAEIQRILRRILKLEQNTVRNMKQYFRKMWIISDEMEENAILKTSELMNELEVRENILNFQKYRIFPWEKNMGS